MIELKRAVGYNVVGPLFIKLDPLDDSFLARAWHQQ